MKSDNSIISNQATCRKCGDTIYSSHRHDFKTCKCGRISVDGGSNYIKRVFKEKGDIIEQSIIMPIDVIEACLIAMEKAEDSSRNNRGILYSILRTLRDSGYIQLDIMNSETN